MYISLGEKLERAATEIPCFVPCKFIVHSYVYVYVGLTALEIRNLYDDGSPLIATPAIIIMMHAYTEEQIEIQSNYNM